VVASAYADVLAHNERHAGFRAGIGNILKAIIDTEDSHPDAPAEEISASINQKQHEAAEEGDIFGELQEILHENTFMRIGVKLAPMGNRLANTVGTRASSTELVPFIDDAELFTDFLGHVNPEEIQQDESSLALVTDIITTLQKTVAACYDKIPEHSPEELQKAMQQNGEDTLKKFLKIDEAYKKAGLDNPAVYQRYIAEGTSEYLDDQWIRHNTATEYLASYRTLEDYVTYWRRGVLPEYIQIGSMEYLAQDALPFLDGMHGNLLQKVDEVTSLTQADRTREFGVEAASALLLGLEETTKEIEENPDAWFSNDRNKGFIAGLRAKLHDAIDAAADSQ
jgi:hypothetical protein